MIPSRIIAFGSSSVAGRGDPVGGGFVGRLAKWHQSVCADNTIINLGLPGDSTLRMLQRLSFEAPKHQPELILLYPGLNDCRRRTRDATTVLSPADCRRNVELMVDRCMKIAPTIFISAFPIDEQRTTPWTETGQFYLAADAANFTNIGREVCESKGAKYVPIFETWSGRRDISEISIDGLHCGPMAHQELAEILERLIVDIFTQA